MRDSRRDANAGPLEEGLEGWEYAISYDIVNPAQDAQGLSPAWPFFGESYLRNELWFEIFCQSVAALDVGPTGNFIAIIERPGLKLHIRNGEALRHRDNGRCDVAKVH